MNKQNLPVRNFSVEKAYAIQNSLSMKVILQDRLPRRIRTVAGIDVSYTEDLGVSAVAVLDYETLNLLETETAICKVLMPYFPTLLSFREMAPAIAAIKKLKLKPDVFLVDAQGWAHPRRCGFASHLGLALGKPTIGAAKTRLFGQPIENGRQTLLVDKTEVIGAEVTTEINEKPIFVSVGHMVSLETAVEIVKRCSKRRIPEPILLAHKLATRERDRLRLESKVNIAEK